MMLRAQVRNGRLELSEPTDLPEGEVVDLVPVEDAGSDDKRPFFFETEDEVRAHVLAAYQRSRADYAAGDYVDAMQWIAERRASRQQR